ncbi:hypothetical protein MMC07_004602 [Pseudocyphellaria aurata]|nr:hypothetical protein [Pseudocyphellaria aurata]
MDSGGPEASDVPFSGLNPREIELEVDKFMNTSGLHDWRKFFIKGALLAQDPGAFDDTNRDDDVTLSPEEKEDLSIEKTRKWVQAGPMWILVGCLALGPAIQGFDETAVNSAQFFYQDTFNITSNPTIIGLVNSAPYLCSAFSCWLTDPLNAIIGRRGVIFGACLISCFFCFAQAFSHSWKMLFVYRFILGFGIGPKSATIPIYAAECAPANVRGALVMMWQIFVAFGIMCGYVAGVIFQQTLGLDGYPYARLSNNRNLSNCYPNTAPKEHPDDDNSNPDFKLGLSDSWRCMVFPCILAAYVYTLPESPRWLLQKARRTKDPKKYYEAAFASLLKLRRSKIQAARDLITINHLLGNHDEVQRQPGSRIKKLFTVRRNRRALTASLILMFFQQFCGVNVPIYYSVSIFSQANFSIKKSLLASMGFGIVNFVGAFPAFYTIDTFGRRNLVLWTFPFMALFQLAIGLSSLGPKDRQNVPVLVFMYLFNVAYSPGEGPVPFVYSAESMPLYIRDLGMGLVTATLWFLNFVIAISWPTFFTAFSPPGAFSYYAAWCVVGWILIFFFVPETKGRTLEGLDQVFEQGSWEFARQAFDDAREALISGRNTARWTPLLDWIPLQPFRDTSVQAIAGANRSS